MNRKGAFRASGSSNFDILDSILRVAFEIAKKLLFQTIAFYYISDRDVNPLIVQMSYGFGTEGSGKFTRYRTLDLEYHEGKFNPQGWMINATERS